MMADRELRIRVAGSGGQGAMLAGVLLADAGMIDGLHVAQTQTYGPQARLGAAAADVILSPEPIAVPHVAEPDTLVCLSHVGFEKYGDVLAPGGLRLLDEQFAPDVRDEGRTIALPLLRVAADEHSGRAVNVVALGALVCLRDVVSRSALREALDRRVKPEYRTLNRRALALGYRLVRARRDSCADHPQHAAR